MASKKGVKLLEQKKWERMRAWTKMATCEDAGNQMDILLYREVLCFVFGEDWGKEKQPGFCLKSLSSGKPMPSNCWIQKSKGLFLILLLPETPCSFGFAGTALPGSPSPSQTVPSLPFLLIPPHLSTTVHSLFHSRLKLGVILNCSLSFLSLNICQIPNVHQILC